MEVVEFPDLEIKGISAAVPSNRIDNLSFSEQFGERTVQKTIKATGCISKYFASEEQTASDLGLAAARVLIEKRNIDTNDIGVVIFASQTPDYKVPATAMIFHKELRCDKNCIVFDMNLGCSGFVYGLYTVCSLLKNIRKKYGLLIVGDISSKLAGKEDRSGMLLFGDGVSAILVGKSEGSLIRGAMLTDGNRYHSIMVPAGGLRHSLDSGLESIPVMDGIEVFNFSTNDVVDYLLEYQRIIKEETKDFDTIVLHQANISILNQIKKKLNAASEQIPISIDRYGNTSGASIPITLCDHYGIIQGQNANVLLSGFGVGLSCGIIDTVIDTDAVYPVITTDYIYNDGLQVRD